MFKPNFALLSLPSANKVWGKVIFLHLSVILFTGGSTWTGIPRAGTPHWEGTPPRQVPLPQAGTSQSSACWEIRATSRQYASHWNAFLFQVKFERVINGLGGLKNHIRDPSKHGL